MENYIGLENSLAEIHENLRKKTEIALNNDIDSFEKLSK